MSSPRATVRPPSPLDGDDGSRRSSQPRGALREVFLGHRAPKSYTRRIQRVYRWVMLVYGVLMAQRGAEIGAETLAGFGYLLQGAVGVAASLLLFCAPQRADTTMRVAEASLMVGYLLRVHAVVGALPASTLDLVIAMTGFLGVQVVVQTVFSSVHARKVGLAFWVATAVTSTLTVVWHHHLGTLEPGTRAIVFRFVVSLGAMTAVAIFFAGLVSDRTRLEHELSARAAEAATRARSAFLSGMSHELRTPLNSILGFAHLLSQDAGATAKQRERAQFITTSGERLLGLLNGVLRMATTDTGPEVFERSAPEGPGKQDGHVATVPAADIAGVPAPLLERMRDAVLSCDAELLSAAIEQLEVTHASLARDLRQMALRYDYDALEQLLQA